MQFGAPAQAPVPVHHSMSAHHRHQVDIVFAGPVLAACILLGVAGAAEAVRSHSTCLVLPATATWPALTRLCKVAPLLCFLCEPQLAQHASRDANAGMCLDDHTTGTWPINTDQHSMYVFCAESDEQPAGLQQSSASRWH